MTFKHKKNLWSSAFLTPLCSSMDWSLTGTWLGNYLNVFSSSCMQDIPILNDLKCQFISYRFEIWTNTLAQEEGHCTEHNPLFDNIKIPLWAIIFVYLARVGFTRFSAPPPLFLPQPGVISMRINLAINHSVLPLPDVIQGLLKTSALCDVYGRREIWALAAQPKDPCAISLWDTHTVSQLLLSWTVPNSQTSSSGDRNNQSQIWPTAVLSFRLILFIKSVQDTPTHIPFVVYCIFLN